MINRVKRHELTLDRKILRQFKFLWKVKTMAFSKVAGNRFLCIISREAHEVMPAADHIVRIPVFR